MLFFSPDTDLNREEHQRFISEVISERALPLTIDITPGSFPNSINPRSSGKIPVAILTTDATNNTVAIDATTVDPTTTNLDIMSITFLPS
jgi:hypothetical protein